MKHFLEYIFSIETKSKELTEKQNRQNLCLLRPGIQTSFTVVIFFVLIWRIINEFEKICDRTVCINSRFSSFKEIQRYTCVARALIHVDHKSVVKKGFISYSWQMEKVRLIRCIISFRRNGNIST